MKKILRVSFQKPIAFRGSALLTILLMFVIGLPSLLFGQTILPGTKLTVDWRNGVSDYILPANIIAIYVDVTGATGGWGDESCTFKGGLGAFIQARIPVNDACAPQTLLAGGTIRLIAGSVGRRSSLDFKRSSGGGGGGSAVLYKAPSSSDWIILVAAGGGGGASQNQTLYGDCWGQDGGDAQLNTNGGDGGGSAGKGGTNGNGGNGWFLESYGGGGAFSNGITAGPLGCTGKAGFPNGGDGGDCDDNYISIGGQGFGGGAAGYHGGGGGGGYSGGGGGNLFSGGGGGGSYVSSWATQLSESLSASGGSVSITSQIGTSGESVSLVSLTLTSLQIAGCDATDVNANNSGFAYSTSATAITLAQFNAAGGAINIGSCSVQSITYFDQIDPTDSKILHRTFTVTDINNNTASCTQVITVDNPAIVASITPSTQTVCINTRPATISVDAFSQNGITTQWYSSPNAIFSNSTIIPGAMSGSYSPPASDVADVTYYFVQIADGCGAVSRKSSKVTVVSASPVITTDVTATPYNITLNDPGPPLSVIATGSNLTYKWYNNTINSNEGGTLVLSGAGNTFIPPVRMAGTSYYYAVVEGACGSVKSSVATLIVNAVAIAGTISGEGAVCSPTNTTTLTLSGYVGTIQWQSSADNVTFNDITAATNADYTAANLTANTWYQAVITSGSTTATSPSVEITVTPTTIWYKDVDDDGYSDGTTETQCARPENYKLASELIATSGDCNDANAVLNPATLWYEDRDGDGYPSGDKKTGCVRPKFYYGGIFDLNDFTYGKLASELTSLVNDCNDADAGLNPGTIWYKDADNDGFSDGTTEQECYRPSGYKKPSELISTGGDCNDADAAINPNTKWYPDMDNDGYSTGNYLVQCERPEGYKLQRELTSIVGDCNDNNASINPNTTWLKDGDNDGYTDGTTKYQCLRPTGYKLPSELISSAPDCNDADAAINPATVWYKDADDDGYSDGTMATQCTMPTGYKLASELIATSGDCDDANAVLNPATLWYEDRDGDGYPSSSTATGCERHKFYYGGFFSFTYTLGKLASELTSLTTDCDDANAYVNPGIVWYKDADNDGFSDGTAEQGCYRPSGYKKQSELISTGGDCNDADAAINPNTKWYPDMDNDGYSTGNYLVQCERLEGYKLQRELTSIVGDCNDNNASINPNTTWLKDGDNDGYTDGTFKHQCTKPAGYKLPSELISSAPDCNDADAAINPATVWVLDADGDGYYAGNPVTRCSSPGTGYLIRTSELPGDCDDANSAIHPGKPIFTCPSAKEVNLVGNCQFVVPNVTAGLISTNNCSNTAFTQNPAAGTLLNGVHNGTYNVTVTATDGNGYSSSCAVVLTAKDNGKPVITYCPTVSVLCYNPGGTYSIPSLTATDNCGAQSISYIISGVTSRSGNSNDASGVFNPGINTIAWKVTDVNGNAATCTTTVKVDKVDVTIADVYASGINSSIGLPNTIYIGYGGSSVTLTAQVTSSLSPNSYVYKWTTGSPAGPGVATTQSITVSPSSTTTYFVSIKDVNNCAQTFQVPKQINVVDIRCGTNKITFCQFRNGSYTTTCVSSSPKTISGLPAGSYLGACVQTVTTKSIIPEGNASENIEVRVMPNPTNTNFKLIVKGNHQSDEIKMLVVDMYGRMIEQRMLPNEQTITLGDRYRPGVYIVKFVQGKQSQQLKLIKLPD